MTFCMAELGGLVQRGPRLCSSCFIPRAERDVRRPDAYIMISSVY